MSINLSFNQVLAVILVGMLLVLLITIIVLTSKTLKTVKKFDGLADASYSVVDSVNGAVDNTVNGIVSSVSNISVNTAKLNAVAAAIIVIEVDRKIRRIKKILKKK